MNEFRDDLSGGDMVGFNVPEAYFINHLRHDPHSHLLFA